MINVFRNEIWTASLEESSKNIIKGVHPVLIISSFKHILKANTVHVLPITSKHKNQVNHVNIEDYGLEKSSVILTEQIITINKADLINRIGILDGIKMKEVSKALKKQLQLEGNNLNAEDLKEILKKQSECIDKLTEISLLRTNIKKAYIERDYNKSISLCNEMIEKVSKSNIDNTQDFLWYGNYALSLAYIKENSIDMALKYASKSLEYIRDVDITHQNYTLSMWSMARCYEELDPYEAREIYNILATVYTKNNNNKMRLSCQFATAFIDKNVSEMANIITIIKSYESDKWYFGEEKESVLEQMQMQLNAISNV